MDNLKKETPITLTTKTGETISLRNEIYFKNNLTKSLHFFDPDAEDPEVTAFKPKKNGLEKLNPFNLAGCKRESSTPIRPGCDLLAKLTRKQPKKLERDDF